MNSQGRKRVIGVFPVDMLKELEAMNEISFDSSGRVRGFSDYVQRAFKRNRRPF